MVDTCLTDGTGTSDPETWYGEPDTTQLFEDVVYEDRGEICGIDVIRFDDLESAQDKIQEMDDIVYYLAHNESGRPDHRVIPA